MSQLPGNTGYPEGTNWLFGMGIPCRGTLPKNAPLHWATLCTGYLRVSIFPKKSEVMNMGIEQQVHVHFSKVFEMGALGYPDTL